LAAILVLVRSGMKLQAFLREEHFNALGKLVMVAGIGWLYMVVRGPDCRMVWQRANRY